MTKQEYEAKNQQLRDAYICDSDYFGRLVDVDSEYIASLEAENEALLKRINNAQLYIGKMASADIALVSRLSEINESFTDNILDMWEEEIHKAFEGVDYDLPAPPKEE